MPLSEAGIELLKYKGLWLVEVHPAENIIRITPEVEALTANLEAFAEGAHVGYQFVTLHVHESSAKEMGRRIRTRVRDEAGTRLAFDVRLRNK